MTSLPQKTHIFFAFVFIFGLFGLSAWNIHEQKDALVYGVSQIDPAHSLREPGQYARSLSDMATWNVTGRYEAWAAHAYIQQALGKSEMNNFSVIKARDGHLYRGGLYPLDLDNARNLAGDIANFADATQERGAKVLYMNLPGNVAKGITDLPRSMPYRDYNIAADALLYVLRENGVPSLDIRHDFMVNGFPPDAVFPKTARMLSGHAAFEAFGRLVDGLEREFGARLDPCGSLRDLSRYQVTTYPQFFMGELGKETGPAFSGLDDFTTISPGFETRFFFEAIDLSGDFIKQEGDAEQTILRPAILTDRKNLYEFFPQRYYIHSNTAWSRIRNLDKPDGPRLLVLHDAYSAQIISHLASLAGELHTVTYQDSFPLNAGEYAAMYDFEYIIIAFSPENLLWPEMRLLLETQGGQGEPS